MVRGLSGKIGNRETPMKTAESLPAMYEDLANHFARQGESRQRDQCLVLAADAAQNAGMTQEAERLRKRLLLTNPHHLLRPYTSMAEAMQSNDVRDYVLDLRKQWPPETVGKLLKPSSSATSANHSTTSQAAYPGTPALETKPDEPIGATSYLLSLLIFTLGLACAIGVLFVAIGWPFVQ
jgi:hypothetical protein